MPPESLSKPQFPYPVFHEARSRFSNGVIIDIAAAVDAAVESALPGSGIVPGDSVAVAVGSRGITGIAQVVSRLCRRLTDAGARPVIVPAMGSHGGASAEGQRRVLEALGISEAACGAPVRAAMDTQVVTSVLDGVPVHVATEALRCRHTVLVNRIKPHTKFKAPLESGLYKMLVVGLGKHAGARVWHQWAIRYGFYPLLEAMGDAALAAANVRFGIAIVENAAHQPLVIEAVSAERMKAREAALLAEAKSHFPKLPFRRLDALVIGRAGKDISGAGMDPNVTGRAYDLNEEGFGDILQATRLAVLDLSEKTGGNAIGIGNADFITGRVFEKMDVDVTQVNALTSLSIRKGAIPIRLHSEAAAIQACFTTIGPVPPEAARVVIIRDTRDLNPFWVSAALVPELTALAHVDICAPQPLVFDADGRLKWPPCHFAGD
ncbi:MAG: hypothetical protein ABIL58_14950 [Pseudomonadota bacterium]